MKTIPYKKCEHETAIVDFFGEENVYVGKKDNRFEGVNKYIICFANRSGSNVLAECISKDSRHGRAREFLNAEDVIGFSKKNEISTFADYLFWVLNNNSSGGRSIGLKASWRQLAFLIKTGVLSNCLYGVKFIHIHRRDAVAQAVSFSIASQTKKWASFQSGDSVEPEFNESEIVEFVRSSRYSKAMFETLFDLHGLDVYQIAYEDFVSSFSDSTLEVWKYLGFFSDLIPFDEQEITMRKQSGQLNDRFKNLIYSVYREEATV